MLGGLLRDYSFEAPGYYGDYMLAMLDTPLAAVLAGRLQEERGRDPRHRARPRLEEHLRHLVPRRRRHRHHRQQRDGHQRPPHHRVCRHVSRVTAYVLLPPRPFSPVVTHLKQKVVWPP